MCLAGRVPALLVALAGGLVVTCGSALPAVAAPTPVSPQAQAERARVPPGAPQAALPTGSLGGTVVNSADRTPLARARVVLTSPALAEPRVVLSGADGTYQFQHLPAASYSLSATRSGYAPQEYGQRRAATGTPVSLGDGQRLTGIDFALAPAGVIAGVVLDEDDKPFAGATIDALVSRTNDNQPTLVSVATARSDDRGEFRLTGLAAGQYYVSAFDPAFAGVGDETGPLRYTPTYYPGVALVEQAARVVVTPGAEPPRITFKLRIIRPSRISGVITAEGRRQLLSGAVIMAPIRGEWLNTVPTQDVVILPDGSFVFRNIPPGSYQIRARGQVDPGGSSLFATYRVLVDGRDIGNVALVLQPGGSVAGHLMVEAVRPARPPRVSGLRVRAPFADGSSFGDTVTGLVLADGSFMISDLMSGNHTLTVEGLQYPWVLKSVTYRGQDITDTGLDVSSRQQRFDEVRVAITDVASEVSGIVRDAAGAAVPDATVLIVPLSDQFWTRTSRRLGVLRTDAGGRYRVRGLPAGEYRAVASLEMDESEAYRPGLLRTFRQVGVALSLKNLEERVLDLPLTSMAATTGGARRQEAGAGDRRQQERSRADSCLLFPWLLGS
jgi:carboxypeptidase family protein